MTGLVRVLGVLSLAAAMLVTGCKTVAVQVEEAPKLQAVQIADPSELAPIKFSRVGVNLRRGTVIGNYIYDPFGCSPIKEDLYWNQGPIRGSDFEFSALFFETLSAANFNVVGDPNKLFEEAEREQIKPEYLVGGQIEDIRMNVCKEWDFLRGRPLNLQRGTASVRVSWQIFSQFDRKVVYRTETLGSVNRKEGVADGEYVLITDAFADAVANLAANERFVDLLREKPRTIADVRDVEDTELIISGRPAFDTPITENIDLIRRSVVTLDTGAGHGSGFFVSPTLILTNHHVVANEDLLRVHLVTGRKILGEVVRKHPERDIALVQVEAAGHQPLPLRLEPVKITEEVYAAGSPLDKELAGTISKGIVSKFGTNRYGLEDIHADVDVHGGNSGGPLVDGSGNVVGVTYSGISAGKKKLSTGLNFFIPIYDALDKLNVTIDRTRGKVVTN